MPQATKINIYLGTGREGNERERLISKAAKEKGLSMSEFVWNCIKEKVQDNKQITST